MSIGNKKEHYGSDSSGNRQQEGKVMAEITSYQELERLLRDRRQSCGMSRQELAELIDSRYDVIRLYEQGERIMMLDKLFRILDALGISLSEDFVLRTKDGVAISPQVYHIAIRLSALKPESCHKLVRKIQAMLKREEENSL